MKVALLTTDDHEDLTDYDSPGVSKREIISVAPLRERRAFDVSAVLDCRYNRFVFVRHSF